MPKSGNSVGGLNLGSSLSRAQLWKTQYSSVVQVALGHAGGNGSKSTPEKGIFLLIKCLADSRCKVSEPLVERKHLLPPGLSPAHKSPSANWP